MDAMRGFQAECPGCGITFVVPETGSVGLRVPVESDASETGEAGKSKDAWFTDKCSVSGIHLAQSDSKIMASTLVLSRSDLVGNTMRPDDLPEEPEDRFAASVNVNPPTIRELGTTDESTDAEDAAGPDDKPAAAWPSLTELAGAGPRGPLPTEEPTPADDEPSAAPDISGLPPWLRGLQPIKGEEFIACEVPTTPDVLLVIMLSFVPVALIPFALLCDYMVPDFVGRIILFSAGGFVLWLLAMIVLAVTSPRRTALVVSNRRVVLVSKTGVHTLAAVRPSGPPRPEER